MSTKTTEIGSTNSAHYLFASGSGSNGKYIVISGKQKCKWNDYTFTSFEQSLSPTDTLATHGPGHYYMNGINYKSYLYNPSTNAINKAQSKLLDNTKNHSFNLGVALGEGHQTVNLVKSTLLTIGAAALSLKRGDFSSAARHLGVPSRSHIHTSTRPKRALTTYDISGRWLELQYGWLPLLSDVYESFKAFHALSAQPRSSRVSASSSERHFYEGSPSPSLYSIPVTMNSSRKYIYEMTEVLSAPRQLGLYDPLSVAWEIMPWSFVVDWFVPIGTYLSNLNQIPFLTGRFMTITTQSASGSCYTSSNNDFHGCSISGRFYSYTRTASTGLSTSFPTFKPLPNALSDKHVFNAIALARQQFDIDIFNSVKKKR